MSAKRVLSLFLTAVMVFTLMPGVTAYAVVEAVGIATKDDLSPAVAERRTDPQPDDPATALSSPTLAQSTTAWFGGYQWVIIGWDGEGVASEQGTATLLFANANTMKPSNIIFRSSSNQYAGSDLQYAMNNISTFPGITDRERSAIKARSLTGGSGNFSYNSGSPINTSSFTLAAGSAGKSKYIDGYQVELADTFDWYAYHGQRISGALVGGEAYNLIPPYHPDNAAGDDDNLKAEYFWPLSVAEASLLNSSIRAYDGYWWLRSPGGDNHNVACAGLNGLVDATGFGNSQFAVRPAFKLDLSSVLFISAAAGGKSSATVGSGILSAAEPPTGAVKFTMLNSETDFLALTSTDTGARTVKSGETVSIAYSGAKTDTNKYVSAVITDNDGAVLYYGKLSQAESSTASFTVPGLENGNYTIKLFNEQANGDNFTDFASAPIKIPMTVNCVHEEFDNGLICTKCTVIPFTVTGGTYGTDFTYAGGVLTITKNGTYTIGMRDGVTAASRRIEIANGVKAEVTLNGVKIEALNSGQSPLKLNTGANVTLILAGSNTLTAGANAAGIHVPVGAALSINGTGSLTATGGRRSAGIGGSHINATDNHDGTDNGNGAITINGGTITAVSSAEGAGIGAGWCGSNVGGITINGGTVNASATGTYGAGIGTGSGTSSQNAGNITFNGGTITAVSGSANGAQAIGTGVGVTHAEITVSNATKWIFTANTTNVEGGTPTQFVSLDNEHAYKYIKLIARHILDTVTYVTLSSTGIATWTDLTDETGLANYSVQLYKNSTAEGSPKTSGAGTGSAGVSLLSEMRAAGVGSYTVKVTAIGNGTTHVDGAESDASAAQTVVKLSAPANPAWSDTNATFDKLSDETNVDKYSITINGSGTVDGNTTADVAKTENNLSVAVTNPANGDTFTVKAIALTTGLFLDSDASRASSGYITNAAPTVKSGAGMQSGRATPASNDKTTAAAPYTADVSDWFDDANGDLLSYSIASENADGSVGLTGKILTFTPNANDAAQSITIVIKANDGTADSTDNVTITVTVGAVPADTPPNTAPSFTVNPSDQNVTEGNNASFTVAANGNPAPTYQWQENSGSGWNNISNGGVYSGSNTATLTLTSVTLGMNGYQYRCVAANGKEPDAESNSATLTVDALPVKTVSVGAQSGILTAGTAGSVTFAVTTANITSGSYAVTADGAPAGVTSDSISISDNNGTLTLTTTNVTPQGTHPLTITIDGITSDSFNLVVDAPPVKTVSVGAQSGTLTAGTAGSVTFAVMTANITSGSAISLNNTNNIAGISLVTSATSGNDTTITISTTGETPNGIHPMTLTIDGVTSTSFSLTVNLNLISEALITGITAPVTGNTPVTTAPTGGAGYTCATVTWSPQHSAFQSGTRYTAAITLTAKPGYTFTGLNAATINGQTAAVTSNTGSEVTLSYEFAATHTPSGGSSGRSNTPQTPAYQMVAIKDQNGRAIGSFNTTGHVRGGVISIKPSSQSDSYVFDFNLLSLKELENANKGGKFVITLSGMEYELPFDMINNITGLADFLGNANLRDYSLDLTIKRLTGDGLTKARETFRKAYPGGEVSGDFFDIGYVLYKKGSEVDFDANQFDSAVTLSLTTTKKCNAVFKYDAAGGFSFVPAKFSDRKAAIKTKTHSVYVAALNSVTFSDVKAGEWYEPFVVRAANKGLVTGYAGLFRPSDEVTRAEFIQMIVNAIQLPEAKTGTKGYADVPTRIRGITARL